MTIICVVGGGNCGRADRARADSVVVDAVNVVIVDIIIVVVVNNSLIGATQLFVVRPYLLTLTTQHLLRL